MKEQLLSATDDEGFFPNMANADTMLQIYELSKHESKIAVWLDIRSC